MLFLLNIFCQNLDFVLGTLGLIILYNIFAIIPMRQGGSGHSDFREYFTQPYPLPFSVQFAAVIFGFLACVLKAWAHISLGRNFHIAVGEVERHELVTKRALKKNLKKNRVFSEMRGKNLYYNPKK